MRLSKNLFATTQNSHHKPAARLVCRVALITTGCPEVAALARCAVVIAFILPCAA
jgi:hypothetical protein